MVACNRSSQNALETNVPDARFNPQAMISPLAARLLKVSNAASFSGLHRDGAFDEVGASRHARFGFHWGR